MDLLNHGFPPESPLTIRDSAGSILLERTYSIHLACEYNYLEILRELIVRGCNIESIDSLQRTPLMVACEAGNLEIVEYLTLNCKVSTKGLDYAGNGVLHISALNGQLEILKFLVDRIGINIKTLNRQKKTALMACRDLYADKFDPVLEKTLSYLIYKNSQNSFDVLTSNNVETVHLNSFNCHEMCKEKYFKNFGGVQKPKIKGVEISELFLSKVKAYLPKRKVRSYYENSFEQVAAIKSDQVYRKVLNEELLPSLEKGRKVSSYQSSPLLMIKERKFDLSVQGEVKKSGSCKTRQ